MLLRNSVEEKWAMTLGGRTDVSCEIRNVYSFPGRFYMADLPERFGLTVNCCRKPWVAGVRQEPTASQFTDREPQVLSYVFEGLANKEIAERIGVSESSVKATLQQLFSKTGVRTRSQLVRIALEQYKEQL
jgi:DNA-binding NarL/FixJ family response regulator